MANTKIQIKRSTITDAPGSLDIGELAYSYSSNTLYIGNTSGSGVIAIGGLSLAVSANAYAGFMANAANAYTVSATAAANNYAGFMANAANAYMVTSTTSANNYSGFMANSVNAYVDTSTTSSNNYAGFMANAANSYASATYVKLISGTPQTITSDIALNGNLTIAGTTTYANTQTLLIGDNLITLNADIPNNVTPAEDAGIEVNRGNKNSNAALLWIESTSAWAISGNTLNVITDYIATNSSVANSTTSANNYAGFMANAANAFAAATYATITNLGTGLTSANNYSGAMANSGNNFAGVMANSSNNYAGFMANAANSYASATYATITNLGTGLTSANNYAGAMANSSNNFAGVMANSANTNAANGSYISTGIVKVPYGGTGMVTFTTNGILYGNSTGDLKVTSADTEGQVLQASLTGVPQFGMLDGGSF